MKIEKLDLDISNSNLTFPQMVLTGLSKINELIDAHNATQPDERKDMTFEEALVHFKAGKQIRRNCYEPGYYLTIYDLTEKITVDLLANDWRVIE